MNDTASALQKTRTQIANLERLLIELKSAAAELESSEALAHQDRVSARDVIASLSQLDSAGTQVDLAESFLDALVDFVSRSILFTRGGTGALNAAVARGFEGTPWSEAVAGGDRDPIQVAAVSMEVVELDPSSSFSAPWMARVPVSGHAAAVPLLFGDAVQAVLYVESDAPLPLGAIRLIAQFTTVVFQNHYLREMVEALGGTAPQATTAGGPAAEEEEIASPSQAAARETEETSEASEFTEERLREITAESEEEGIKATILDQTRGVDTPDEAVLPEPADVAPPASPPEDTEPEPEGRPSEPPAESKVEEPAEEEERQESEPPAELEAEPADHLEEEPARAALPDERTEGEADEEEEEPPLDEAVLEIGDLSQVDADELGLTPAEFERLMGQASSDWKTGLADRSAGEGRGANAKESSDEADDRKSFDEALGQVLPHEDTLESPQETADAGSESAGTPQDRAQTEPDASVDRDIIPEVARPKELESAHSEARRFARLLVAEIKLYNENEVEAGRKAGDLYARLREDIDRSREMYEKRAQPEVKDDADYFHDELVRVLTGGDAELLGEGYPGNRLGEV